MAKQKLTFRFHDPNPAATAADYIAKLFVEVNQHKIEAVLREASILKTESEKPAGP